MKRWCGTLERVVWYFEEVVWYYEEGGVVLVTSCTVVAFKGHCNCNVHKSPNKLDPLPAPPYNHIVSFSSSNATE